MRTLEGCGGCNGGGCNVGESREWESVYDLLRRDMSFRGKLIKNGRMHHLRMLKLVVINQLLIIRVR